MTKVMAVACILSTFGKHWVRRTVSEPWSTLGRHQCEMFINMETLKNLLKFDSQNLESPFKVPTTHGSLFPEAELGGYRTACALCGEDQGSFSPS